MGYPLYRHVMDHAPAELKGGDRYVLAVIADDANDTTRRSWISQELIAHRTGLQPDSIQKALRRIVRIVGEFRVPLGTDKKGRPVYAARGHRTVYEIPVFAAREVPGKGGPSSAQPGGERADSGPQRADSRPRKGGFSSAPSPQSSPQGSPHPDARVVQAVISELAAATGRQIDDEWADRVAKQILAAASGDVASPVAYVTKAIRAAAAAGEASRFLPTPVPGRFDPSEVAEETLPPRPDPVMETAPCGHQRVVGDDQECWLCAQEQADAAPAEGTPEPADAPDPPADTPDRPTLTIHPGGGRPPRRNRNQPPLLTALDTPGTPDTVPTAPPPELAERLARHARGYAGRTRTAGGTA